MRLGLFVLASLLAGCTLPSSVPDAESGAGRWQVELQAPLGIHTTYEEGAFQRVLLLRVEVANPQTVQVFGDVSIYTEHWQETKLWHRLTIDGIPRDLGELADGYGYDRDAGKENGQPRKTGTWNDSWNEAVSLGPGAHVIEYDVKSHHMNKGDYASGSNPMATSGSLTAVAT